MVSANDNLPEPKLDARLFGARRISMLTDDALFDALGVRIAFTSRDGGVSAGAFASLNLGSHVDDSLDDVMENRRRVMEALGANGTPLLVPNQVHGSNVELVESPASSQLVAAQQRMALGADALAVTCTGVGALLCYADCTPVIIVASSGAFAVIHAGWRGVVSGVAVNALRRLAIAAGAETDEDVARFASECNVYVGPHISSECFEVGSEVVDTFKSLFGDGCIVDGRHVSMLSALRTSLCHAGIRSSRICHAGICTQCNPDKYYSYRASGGKCGRHGAIAFRKV